MARPGKGRGRASTPARTAPPARAVSAEAQARLPELLALSPESDIVARVAALATETPGGALALIDALGSSRDPSAGFILSALALGAGHKEERKAARRALHKLRGAGLAVAVPVPAEPSAPVAAEHDRLRPAEARVSPSDGVGSRLLWLTYERELGGLLCFTFVLNDIVGLKDMLFEETTHRRFDRRIEAWSESSGLESIEIPFGYGQSLLSEALALNAESGFPLPREFVIRRAQLGELPPPPTAALIHQHVSRGQSFLMPNLTGESARLVDEEPELSGWLFSYGEVEPYARELRQIGDSRLILTTEPRETRQERVIDAAMDALLTPEVRRGFRRRLEELAYVFWETGRERAARRAVAAAFAITDTGSLRAHPLLRELIRRSIDLAAEVIRSGLPPPPGANRTARDPI